MIICGIHFPSKTNLMSCNCFDVFINGGVPEVVSSMTHLMKCIGFLLTLEIRPHTAVINSFIFIFLIAQCQTYVLSCWSVCVAAKLTSFMVSAGVDNHHFIGTHALYHGILL